LPYHLKKLTPLPLVRKSPRRTTLGETVAAPRRSGRRRRRRRRKSGGRLDSSELKAEIFFMYEYNFTERVNKMLQVKEESWEK
jgi:hypothetical protein